MKTATTGAAKAAGAKSADAVSLLKADHRKVEEIFASFEKSEDDDEKQRLVRQVCTELIIHTKLEEELFYPACREKDVEDDMLDEAQVEHDGAKVLIADILRCSPGDDYYDAKVKTLSEYITHHVGEEEQARSGIFAKAQKAGVDMAGLGQKIQSRKQELMAQGEALSSNPPKPRSFQLQPQESSSMARYSNDRDRDERGRFTDDNDYGRGGYQSRSQGGRERDERGRFASDDDDRGYSRSGGSHGGEGRGWYGDPGGHSRASREGWDERGSSRSSRSRYDEDDDDRRSSRGGGGRGHGGWFGDPEGHSQASREGWEDRGSSRSSRSRYDDDDDDRRFSRSGGGGGRGHGGWFGDPEGHSQASREGWEDRGSSRSSRGRYEDDDDDRRSSRGGGRGHGGWFGDPQGHSEAAREGWRGR
jgi:hemerythrin superfamily protein